MIVLLLIVSYNQAEQHREYVVGEVDDKKYLNRPGDSSAYRKTLRESMVIRLGISTGDLQEALQALQGSDAKRLSAPTTSRSKRIWEEEHEPWRTRAMFISGQRVSLSTFGAMMPSNAFSSLSVSRNRTEKSLLPEKTVIGNLNRAGLHYCYG